MKDKLAKLINVKSLVTLMLTIGFLIALFVMNPIPQEFVTIYTVIISFYFGTQARKE